MAQVYLSVGSNVGNRQSLIKRALVMAEDFCEIISVSSVYETKPWGKSDQPDFLNLCLEVKTSLKPEQLLQKLKEIEKRLGRSKTERWAEREIDIDILFYGSLIQNTSGLAIPHPRIEDRAFVLVPLSEIAPDFVHPILKQSTSELANKVDTKGVKKLTKIMGILNVTPDSFSDGGDLEDKSVLKQKVREMIEAGVDIIDIGGQSTRPGHQKVESEEELQRVLPAIQAVRKVSSYMPISVDTQKAEVAEKSLQAGANIINDVSALSDPKMGETVKKFNCPIILMRNRPLDSRDLAESCKLQFEEIIENCQKFGISKDKIILDPGLGFGDLASGDFSALPGGNPSANTQLVLSIKDYGLDLPVLIGASRKRFLGKISGQQDAKKRLSESLAFAVLAENCGASIVRVHDASETVKALRGI